MGIQFPPIAFLYLLYFYICIYILFCTLVKRILNLNLNLSRENHLSTSDELFWKHFFPWPPLNSAFSVIAKIGLRKISWIGYWKGTSTDLRC